MSNYIALKCCLEMHETGICREEDILLCLDKIICKDNVVRLIDAFVEMLDLEELGFTKTDAKKKSCPIYHATDMLELFYYGLSKRIRSSRKLEAECVGNIEVWWLIHRLIPGYHTIADFRKDNCKVFSKAFKVFGSFLKGEDVFGKELLAQDGTKIRAQ